MTVLQLVLGALGRSKRYVHQAKRLFKRSLRKKFRVSKTNFARIPAEFPSFSHRFSSSLNLEPTLPRFCTL